MEWAVGVTTCPREQETLEASLKSIIAAGFDVDSQFIHDDTSKEHGPYRSFRRLLRKMLTLNERADVFAIFQDDIAVTTGLREHLENDQQFRELLDAGDLISLYTAGPHHQESGGWHVLSEGETMYGALAFVLPRSFAAAFDADPPNPGALTCTCQWLQRFFEQTNKRLWMHSPSFVRHTGTKSAVDPVWEMAPWNAPFRNCRWWLPAIGAEPIEMPEFIPAAAPAE